MSFQVGDLVVHPKLKSTYLYEVLSISGSLIKVKCFSECGRQSFSFADEIRHATPEEIAAGHRIDHCVEATEKVELFGNSEELEVLEMIDVSPNCEVSEL